MLVLLTAFAIDLIVPFALAPYYPHYNHMIDTISTLGTAISPVKFWAGWSLVLVGILYSVFAYGHFQLFEKKGRFEQGYFAGILAFGIGSILAGFFPEDFKGREGESINGKIHGIASFLGFMGLILCPLWANKIEQIKTDRRTNHLLFLLALITFLLFLFSEHTESGILKYTGLFQRLNLLLLYSALLINYRLTSSIS